MVRELRIYIEGGGHCKSKKTYLREGFSEFLSGLREYAREQGIRWNIVLCGGRESAYDDFQTARSIHANAFNVLLVDAEGPIGTTPWEHLKDRDNWETRGASEEQCQLMVQMMEAWLIADPDALEQYYGQGFRRNQIPDRKDVEQIPKADLARSLREATRCTQKGEYAKIRHAAVLLKKIDPTTVRKKARHCERLFRTIEEWIDESIP